MARVRRVVTSRDGGSGRPPYDSFNLSFTVGDDADAVTSNRRRMAEVTGTAGDRFVWMDTVHGAEVARVSGPQQEPVGEVDGLVTTVADLVLVVLAADCVPVLAADEVAGVAGVAHAGRQGAAAGVVDALVESMVGCGARTDRMDILLGPAICGRCYEVPAQMQQEVEARLPGSATRTTAGTAGLDLRAGLQVRLHGLGVRHVVVDSRCTFEDSTFYSFRRDGRTGRQAGLAWVA